MIMSRRVALGGVQLDELHESIIIRSVVPGTPKHNIQSVSRMNGMGNRITTENWEPLQTTVTWAINLKKNDLAARRAVYDLVTAWAMKCGWLTTNEMPDRQMYADRVILPEGADMRDWTRDFTTQFTAYNVPFWQGNRISAAVGTVASGGSVVIIPDGNIDTVLEFTFTNMSGKEITNLTVNVGSKSKMVLENIALPANGQVVLGHGNDGIMRIIKKVGGTETSILANVNASSSDDLYISPVATTVSFSASRAGSMSISCRGRYA